MADKRKVKKVIFIAIFFFILGILFSLALPLYIKVHYPMRYREDIEREARINGIPPSLISAVIYEESRFNKDAISKAGALGLMQIMPSTAGFIAAGI